MKSLMSPRVDLWSNDYMAIKLRIVLSILIHLEHIWLFQWHNQSKLLALDYSFYNHAMQHRHFMSVFLLQFVVRVKL